MSRPSPTGPPFTGHFRITADTPRGLQAFQPTTNAQYEAGKAYRATDAAIQSNYKESPSLDKAKMNLEIRRNIYDQKGKDLASDIPAKQQTNGTTEAKAEENAATGGISDKQLEEIAKEPKKAIYCNSCGIECSRVSFHYAKPIPAEAKVPYIDICPPCFADRRYSATAESKDFVKREDPTFSSIPDKNAAWTDSELLLLLEALEKFDENWNQIADHVATRTREDCVIKFLQLEIEDQYLEQDVSGPNYSGLEAGRIPFSQGDNPVLSVLGYLAGLSEPSVAAAVGGRAIDEQAKRMRRRLEDGMGGDPKRRRTSQGDKEVNTPTENLKSEDAMEVEPSGSGRQEEESQEIVTISDGSKEEDQMRDVANATFAAAATRAAALASHEERELTRLVSATVNSQIQKLDLKLKHFTMMEAALQAERRELERGRQQLFLDRLAFRKRVIETQETLKAAAAKGGEEGAQMADGTPVGLGEKMAFQSEGLSEKTAQATPVPASAPGYSSYEI